MSLLRYNYRKVLFTLLALAGLLLPGCQKEERSAGVQKIDFNKAAIALMDTLRPHLLGSWKINRVNVTAAAPQTRDAGIYKDTTLIDFAALEITSIDNESAYNRVNNDVTGFLTYKGKSYPVGFTVYASGNRIFEKSGPQVYGLFEFRFKAGSHALEPEETYLQNLTLIGDTYSIEISADGKSMTWKGLNRGVKSAELSK